MVRTPSYDKNGLKRGTWTPEEDMKLIAYITRYGCWNWRQLPRFAGLARCGKSCRLRWLNYLRPNIKRGNYTQKEEEIIITLHQKLGNKWSVIATHLPGRTDNEIKNHWHTTLKKRFQKNALTHEKIKSNYSGSDQHMDSVQNNGPLSPQISSTESSSTTTDHTTAAATNENRLMEDDFDFIDANIDAVNEISDTPIEKVPDYGNGNSNFQGSTSDATETFMNGLVMYPRSSSSSESCSVEENDHFAFLEATQSTIEIFWTEPYVADMSHVPNELLTPLVIEPDLEYFSTVYDVDLWSQSHFHDERINFF